MYNKKLNVEYFNDISKDHFPEMLGIVITHLEERKMNAKMSVRKDFFAPNNFLHAGSIVTFADTVAGYSTIAHLPEKGKSFTTLELKIQLMKAIRKGTLYCECTAEHMGKTTQIWRVIVSDMESKKKIAVFSCTQLILY